MRPAPEHPPPLVSVSARRPEIDVLRFGAALAVVLFHYSFWGHATNRNPVAYPELGRVFQYGYLGVELFFMISGFVILQSALHRSARQFVVARIARLYPAFWVAATLTFLATRLVPSALPRPSVLQYLANLTMGQQFLRVPPLDGVYWTLAYELKFYSLIVGISLLGWFRYLNLLLGAWLAVVLWFVCGQPVPVPAGWLFPEYAAFFMAGMLFFLVYQRGPRLEYGLLLLACYGLAITTALLELARADEYLSRPRSAVIVVAVVSSFFLIFGLLALGYTTGLRLRGATALGPLTYPLYLVHQQLGYLVFQLLGPWADRFLLLSSLVALMLGLAYGLHRWVERLYARPFYRWLDQHLPGSAPPVKNPKA
ncbi:acyltransferase [Hymenobacter fastidiosus]|uniref:Acyltransferase n=1 Tax=Hymenobacter fastidiosus TaxID=486264 RepID=A0ABP7RQA0_9BACT